MCRLSLLLLLLLGPLGCASVPTEPASPSETPAVCDPATYAQPGWDQTVAITERVVDPADTDEAISMLPEQRHFVYLPEEGVRRGELMVLFSGSRQGTNDATSLLGISASLGYHAIALGYVSDVSVNQVCQQQVEPTPDCHGEVLAEKIYGDDSTDLIDIDAANSVVGRLAALLGHLGSVHPGEGWAQFLDDDQPAWSRIALAGGSQGGKVSAFLSRDNEVARAVLLSAMGSAYNNGGVPEVALWSQEPRATPRERTYGLWHQEEAADAYAPVILEAYGMDALGPITDVDGVTPPYGCSHQLRTNLLPSTGDMDDAHASLGSDRLLALEDGIPALTPTFVYMMTAEEAAP